MSLMNALRQPRVLYEKTQEHKHACKTLGSGYESASSFLNCVKLAYEYKKSFMYETTLKTSCDGSGKQFVDLWRLMKNRNDIDYDHLCYIHIENPKDVECFELYAVDAPADGCKTKRKDVLVWKHTVSEKEAAKIVFPVPIHGIPTIALQYTILRLVAETEQPQTVTIGCMILPSELRRISAQSSHTMDLYNLEIRGGMFMEKSNCSCAIM